MTRESAVPVELIDDLDEALTAAISAAERDQAVTAAVNLTAKVYWDDELKTVRADLTLKHGKGRKSIAILKDGQLRMSLA